MRATTSGCEIVWPGADRQRDVLPRLVAQVGRHEAVARHLGHRRQHALVVDVAPQDLHQPLRGGRHHATLAPAARTSSSARAESSGSTSTPRVAVLSTVTEKPSRSASSAVFLTQ